MQCEVEDKHCVNNQIGSKGELQFRIFRATEIGTVKKTTLYQEFEVEVKVISRTWQQLESRAQDRVSWRLLVNCL